MFHNRYDGSVYFARDWKSFEEGFGDISGEFWMGKSIDWFKSIKLKC